jgi:hypothetical protein
VITRCITRSAGGRRYHPGMAGDQETMTAAAAGTGGELVRRAGVRPPGSAAVAAELVARTRAELPVLAGLGSGRSCWLPPGWPACVRPAPGAPTLATCGGGWGGWPTAAWMCSARAGCTWTRAGRARTSPLG